MEGDPGPLRSAVVAACAALGPRLPLPGADAVADIAHRAATTPSLVVTGPVSSGKSTLVNALVGRRVAPTGAGECTRLVARYVRGPVDRLDVVLVDGTRRPLPLAPGGRVPAAVGDRLGVDPDDVDHLLVTLTSAALDGLTVVDTPGTGSARGPRAWDPDAVARGADAALVVLPATAQSPDVDALAGPGTAVAAGPAGVVAVLGRADTVASGAKGRGGTVASGAKGRGGTVASGAMGRGGTVGDDDDGAAVAGGLGRLLGDRVGPVTPVIGLLAETAVTGALRTDDVRALGELAAVEREELDVALLDPELFTSAALPVAPAVRAGLLELLDRRGVAVAVERLRAEPGAGVGEIRDELLAVSGLDRLVARIDDEIRSRTDVLAARAAVRRLETLTAARSAGGGPAPAGSAEGADRARDASAELRRRAGFDEADLLAVRARVRSGAVELPAELVDEIDRLGARGPVATRLGRPDAGPTELAAHAARRAAWWRGRASWGTARPAADAAHVVHRTYVRLWRELTGSERAERPGT